MKTDPAEEHLSYLYNSNMYYRTDKEKIVWEKPHKLWKNLTKHLKEMCQRNEHREQHINKKII